MEKKQFAIMGDFNKAAFDRQYNHKLLGLSASEKMTKENMIFMSREALQAVHETGNIIYVNNLLGVLTVANRKVAVPFYKEFTGFDYDEVAQKFVSKNKRYYGKKLEKCIQFLAEPHNNIWTWAERNIEVNIRPFTVENVTKITSNMVKKATEVGISRADIVKGIFAAGFTIAEVALILNGAVGEAPVMTPEEAEAAA